jgi:hypothetical protein
MGLGQLAKQHGHELIPAWESLDVTLGPMLLDGLLKLGPGKQAQDLAEQTGHT